MIIQKATVRNAFVGGLCKLFDGAVEIFSLGMLHSSLHITYVEWWTKRKMR